jgi:hypothetical protein
LSVEPKLLNEPRFPAEIAGGRRGFYEVWFIVAAEARAGLGVWLRYAVDVREGRVVPSIWGAFFDKSGRLPTFSICREHEAAAIRRGEERVIAIGDAELRHDGCTGEVEAPGHSLRWSLSFDDDPAEMPDAQIVIPAALRPLGRLKGRSYVTPRPGLRLSGALEVDGLPVELKGAAGNQSHMSGRQRYSYAWLHCASFDEAPGASLQIAATLGPGGLWYPVCNFHYQGRTHKLAELPWMRSISLRRASPTLHFEANDATLAIDGVAHADLRRCVEVKYVNPDGAALHCLNTELAEVELRVRTRAFPGAPWRPQGTLRSAGGASLEFCGPEADSRVGNKLATAPAAAQPATSVEASAAS